MFAFAYAGIAAAGGVGSGVSSITLSGTLDAVDTDGLATSATRTVTVPVGNSGVMRFENYVDVGTVTNTQYSRNGGAFTAITDGDTTVAFSDGDTIAVQTNSLGVGESRNFNVFDNTTSAIIEAVTQAYG